MPIKMYKPTTAGRRLSSVDAYADITKTKPERRLVRRKKTMSGRNAQGRITVRHRGGGTRKLVRAVDFKRDKYGVPATVAAIEYDPARGARLALLNYADGDKRYMVCPQDLKVGDKIVSAKEHVEIKTGNRMPLEFIPVGVPVHGVELVPGHGAVIARGAGTGVQLMAIEGAYAQIKLPSGEIRLVAKECSATIGMVGNADRRLIRWGKAGRTRHRGRRPQVRGKVMNPVDHPHGGGEGKSPIGMKHPKTPWGKPALGVKTRDPKKASSKFILQRRKTKKR